jgi:hypothetical protein
MRITQLSRAGHNCADARTQKTNRESAELNPLTFSSVLLLAAIASVYVCRWIAHVLDYSVNIPFWDQWGFLSPVFNNKSVLELFFFQWGPHRQGFGNILMATVLQNSNYSFVTLAIASLIIILVTSSVWALLVYRATASLGWSGLSVAVVSSLQSYEMVTRNPNLAHGPLPALFFALAISRIQAKDLKIYRDTIFGVLCVAMVYTGFGLFAGFIGLILMLFGAISDQRLTPNDTKSINITSRLTLPSVCILASLPFFYGYEFAPSVDCFQFPHPRPFEYVQYVSMILGQPFYVRLLGVKGRMLSLLVLLVVVVWLYRLIRKAWLERASGNSLLFIYVLGSALSFAVFTSVGRVCLGLDSALSASRYYLYVFPLAIAIFVSIANNQSIGIGRSTPLSIILAGLILTMDVLMAIKNKPQMVYYSDGKRKWYECIKSGLSGRECNVKIDFKIYPDINAIEKELKIVFERQSKS